MSFYSPLRSNQSSLRKPIIYFASRNSLRYASLNSAIGRGIRKSQYVDDNRESSNENRRRPHPETSSYKSRSSRRNDDDRGERPNPASDELQPTRRGGFSGLPREYQRPQFQSFRRPRDGDRPYAANRSRTSDYVSNVQARDGRRGVRAGREAKPVEFDEAEFIRTGSFRPSPSGPQQLEDGDDQDYPAGYPGMGISKRIRPRSKRLGHHKYTDETPERIKENVVIPDAVPYSHPASEFVYGTAAVEAALRCSKRQFYKLYIYQSKHEELSPQKVSLRKLALLKNIQVKMAFSEWETLLNTMSGGRPHNGLVLEASQLPQTPTQALKPVQLGEDQFRLELASQTREEAAVNGSNDTIPMNRSFTQQHDRYPVILLLSGITDPGNVGAAIRSAYYLGADAVVFAGPNSAPLSTVAIKASAGAAENMTILRVFNEVDFIQRSQANGWRFYAADALSPGATYVDSASIHNNPPTATTSAPGEGGREGEQDHEYPINHAPSVIMLGHEGTGLSMHIKSQADAVVSIPGARLAPGMGVSSDPARVDSLNVSVAAALLIQMFMGGPLGVGPNLKGRKKKVVPNNEKPA